MPPPQARVVVAVALLGICGLWSVTLVAALAGKLSVPLPALLLLPAGLTAMALATRGSHGAAVTWAAALTGVVAAAVVFALALPREPLIAILVPTLAVTAFVCAKRPALAVVTVFALTGSYGSLAAFTPLPSVGQGVDLLLAALWVGVIWGYAVSGTRRPLWVWPGIAAAMLYLGITTFEIFTAGDLSTGLRSFRASTWYMLAFLLVAFAPWRPETRFKIAKGIVVTALAVGAYACFRLIVGAADEEKLAAVASSENDVRASNLGLLGSFPNEKRLAAWCATVIPFSLAFALIAPRWWRLVAIGACLTCVIALFGTGARFAAAGMVLGVGVLVVLYQLARAFPGLHFGATVAVIAAVAGIGTAGFLLTQGGSEEGVERYSQILTPTEAVTYQKRLSRWDDALSEIGENPAGQGLGAVGRVQKAQGDIERIGLQPNLDSSYLKIGIEQGPVIMLLFLGALLLVLIGIATRATTTSDPRRAALGIGACGTLATLCVLFFGGFFIEGLPALAGWLIVGLGASQFTQRDTVEARRPAPAEAGRGGARPVSVS